MRATTAILVCVAIAASGCVRRHVLDPPAASAANDLDWTIVEPPTRRAPARAIPNDPKPDDERSTTNAPQEAMP